MPGLIADGDSPLQSEGEKTLKPERAAMAVKDEDPIRMSDEQGDKPHYEAGRYVHYCKHPGCTVWAASDLAVGRAQSN